MNVDVNTLGGLTVQEARALMRGMRSRSHRYLSDELVAFVPRQLLSIEPLLATLESAGYIAQMHQNGQTWWHLTPSGERLGDAKFTRRISRATAERLLNGVMERIGIINTDPTALYHVRGLWVLGSYLSNTLTLGDLDLVVELERIAAYCDSLQEEIRLEKQFYRRLRGNSAVVTFHPPGVLTNSLVVPPPIKLYPFALE